ncbi:hypothetical protein ER57_11300 [Smithella sp. SCADC]|nr:hypothetical protein ER57_11300 [Smithella sp. SCADC]
MTGQWIDASLNAVAHTPLNPTFSKATSTSATTGLLNVSMRGIHSLSAPGIYRASSLPVLTPVLTDAVLTKKLPDTQPKPPQNTKQTTTEDDNIFILAFVCKPVPRCPNPDENLQW